MIDHARAQSAVQQCIDNHMGAFADAPWEVYQAETERCRNLTDAVAAGDALDDDLVRFLLDIVLAFVNERAYRSIAQSSEPALPLSELPGRLRSATAVAEAVAPLLPGHAADLDHLKRLIEHAKRLDFRWWPDGAPFDFDTVRATRELLKGTVVRAPVARCLTVPFGPTSWSQSMGPARPGRIFVRLGQRPPATVLLLLEQDRPHTARSIRVFALLGRERVLLHEIDDESLWYCEGLDGRLGIDALDGVHFSLWAPPAISVVYLADLGSPLGVYVKVPSYERTDVRLKPDATTRAPLEGVGTNNKTPCGYQKLDPHQNGPDGVRSASPPCGCRNPESPVRRSL